jgi:pyruvate/2-oxoglutarate dehydrogenase complex dihydrolipoamide dehydrogenase (E3) component
VLPNTSDLGLERAGVATAERGYIIVDDQLQTNVPGIWALRDCNGRGAFYAYFIQRPSDRRR